MKLPIRSLGLVAAGLLLGTALAPVAAQQQQSGIDGQVAVRSDGAVYLIANGQRRWVATVIISDDELNAYPEGEPIFAGLAPIGSAQAAANPQQNAQPKPAANSGATPATPATPAPANSNSSGSSAPPTSTPDPNLSSDLLIDVDIDGEEKFEAGDSFKVQIKTKANATCELKARFPGGAEANEDSTNADGSGKCRFNIEIPSGTPKGEGTLVGTVREGGKVNTQEVPFEIVEDN